MTTNIQLENKSRRLKFANFKGVFMRDEIIKLKPLERECGILGSKTTRENDMHWILFRLIRSTAYKRNSEMS